MAEGDQFKRDDFAQVSRDFFHHLSFIITIWICLCLAETTTLNHHFLRRSPGDTLVRYSLFTTSGTGLADGYGALSWAETFMIEAQDQPPDKQTS